MGFVVDGHEVFEGNLGVLLGGGEAGVAEEFLDGAEIGAIAEEVGGVGVAEAVRMQAGVPGESGGVELDDATHASISEAASAVI